MTYNEFQRQLGKAGLTAREFANLILMNRNSITNRSQKGEVSFRNVLAKIDVEPPKPRGKGPKGRFSDHNQSNTVERVDKKDGEAL